MHTKTILFAFIGILSFMNSSLLSLERKDTNTFIKEIRTAIHSLNPATPFIFYNLPFSEGDLNSLKAIRISSAKEYNNFGNLDSLYQETKKFIESLGNANKKLQKRLLRLF